MEQSKTQNETKTLMPFKPSEPQYDCRDMTNTFTIIVTSQNHPVNFTTTTERRRYVYPEINTGEKGEV